MSKPTRIRIYADHPRDAAILAADLNLALRHWEYAGTSGWSPPGGAYADVGAVMDDYHELLRHIGVRHA